MMKNTRITPYRTVLCVMALFVLMPNLGAGGTGPGFGVRDASAEDEARFETNFANPPAGYGEVPFWWWTGEKLNVDRLLWQLEELHKKGISGVQVNYAHQDKCDGGVVWPTYPNDPEIFTDDWWAAYDAVSKQCNEWNMGIGLSGYTLDWQQSPTNLFGRTIYNDPEIQSRNLAVARMLSLKHGESWHDTPENSETSGIESNGVVTVAIVAYQVGDQGIRPETAKVLWRIHDDQPADNPQTISWTAETETQLWFYTATRIPSTLNPLHPESGSRVVQQFFQPFVEHSPSGTSHGLNYFFQDELQLGTGPLLWHSDFPEEFAKRKGYSLFEALPVFYGASCGDRGIKYRLDFFDVRIALAEERYFQPVYNWHNDRGMIYGCDPGSRGLDPFEFGDYFRAIRWYTAPGHDTPGGKADFIKNKVSSSIAHFYNRPRVWLEGYHSLGWGATPERLMQVTCQNFIYGANLLNLHGLYYTTFGSHWEWAPPCYHFRMPYWDHFGSFLKYFERLSFLMSQGRQKADVVVLYPVTDYQADLNGDDAKNCAFDAIRKIYNAGWNVLFIDDQSLARCEVQNGKLVLDGCEYSAFVLPNCRSVRWSTLEKMRELHRSGGSVFALETLPTASDRVGSNDAELTNALNEIFGQNRGPVHADELAAAMPIARDVTADSNHPVEFQHRSFGHRDLYVVMGAKQGSWLTFRSIGRVEFYDPWTGQVVPCLESYQPDAQTTAVRMPLDATNATVVVLTNDEWFDSTQVMTQYKTNLERVTSLTIPTKTDLSWSAEGYADSPGVKTIDFVQYGKTVHLQGNAEQNPAPITLKGPWSICYKPTMNNRFGDFRLPIIDDFIGVEARRFDYAVCDSFDPENPDSALEHAREVTFGYGEKFYRIGPFPAEVADSLEEELAQISSLVPGQTLQVGDNSYLWEPYAFSWRDGIEGNPGHQGYHGLKEYLDNRFIGLGQLKPGLNEDIFAPEESGSDYFLWTTVPAASAVTENADSEANVTLYIEGEPVTVRLAGKKIDSTTPLVETPENRPLLIRCSGAGRRAVVFAANKNTSSAPTAVPSADTVPSVDTVPSPETLKTPLAMKWFDLPGRLDFDLRGVQEPRPQSVFRFMTPPGLAALIITSKEPPRVFCQGKEQNVRPDTSESFGRPGLDGAVRYRVDLTAPIVESVPLYFVLTPQSGDWGWTPLMEPVRLICQEGQLPLGNWNDIGVLADYSGGVCYKKEFVLDENFCRGEIILDLGSLCASASVTVNGELAGTLLAPPWKLNITRFVHSGTNQLEIDVRNTLSNHFRTIPTRYRGDSPSGLLGPVLIRAQYPVHLVP